MQHNKQKKDGIQLIEHSFKRHINHCLLTI